MCVDFGEVVPRVHLKNAFGFNAWFDYDELVIFEVAKCFLLLQCKVTVGFLA